MPFIYLLLFFKVFIYLDVLGLSCHMRDLQLQPMGLINSSLTRDGKSTPCIGSEESKPLGSQGSLRIYLLETTFST